MGGGVNVLGICAGSGALELGIRIARPDARAVAYVEREAFAAAHLVARMEEGWLDPAPVWSDAGTFDPRPWRGVVDLVTSGDPCQPNSLAGKRLGDADDRWLVDQVLRIVDGVRPARFFRENVPGNADGQLEAFVPPLEGMGYRVAAGIFSAAEVGASHWRERLVIMADRDGEPPQRRGGRRKLESPAGTTEGEGHQRERCRRAPDDRCESLDDCLGLRQPGPQLHAGQGPEGCGAAVSDRAGAGVADGPVARLPLRGSLGGDREQELPAAERGGIPLFTPPQNWIDEWRAVLAADPTLEPAVRGAPPWMAHRVDRLRLTGNGVSPLVIAYAWRTLSARLAEPNWNSVRALT